MAKTRKVWRLLTVVGAAMAALALAGAALAQTPPTPPATFYGDAASGSGAIVDGEPAADGAVVIAHDADTLAEIASTTISGGTWAIEVNSSDTTSGSVVFTVDGAGPSEAFEVQDGLPIAVALDLSTGADTGTGDTGGDTGTGETPTGLPNTGTGGLASDGSSLPLLPLFLLAAVVVALGGVAVSRRAAR